MHPEGMPESSRWLRSGATTPPDIDQIHKSILEGSQRFMVAV